MSIKRWIKKEELSTQDAFRIVDQDFDGLISKEDLKKFLIDVLKVKKMVLDSAKIDRLYKLLDYHNRGNIQAIDFEKALGSYTSGPR